MNYIGEAPAHIQKVGCCLNFLVDVFKIVGNAKLTQNNLTSYFSQKVICNVSIIYN